MEPRGINTPNSFRVLMVRNSHIPTISSTSISLMTMVQVFVNSFRSTISHTSSKRIKYFFSFNSSNILKAASSTLAIHCISNFSHCRISSYNFLSLQSFETLTQMTVSNIFATFFMIIQVLYYYGFPSSHHSAYCNSLHSILATIYCTLQLYKASFL